jgi:putative signal transducing protein
MKKCEYCGTEAGDDAAVCPGCGSDFQPPVAVDEDPQLVDPALNLATVASFPSLAEAQLLVSRLEAGGIEACIPEEYSSQIFAGVIPLGMVTVRVAAKDYQEAMSIAAETPGEAPSAV